jgi:hypothetical protein
LSDEFDGSIKKIEEGLEYTGQLQNNLRHGMGKLVHNEEGWTYTG